MSFDNWPWIVGAAVIVLAIGVLDTIKRRQQTRQEASMSPDELAIKRREDKVFNKALARWWLVR